MNNLSRRSTQTIKLYFCFLSCLIIGLILGMQITKIDSVNAEPNDYLNPQVIELRNRVNLLENQLNKTPTDSFHNSQPIPGNRQRTNYPSGRIDGKLIGRSDPAFENLATMVIELKQEIQVLEKRVAKIEKKN
jgi:BMFP domain-containing protein YqiC